MCARGLLPPPPPSHRRRWGRPAGLPDRGGAAPSGAARQTGRRYGRRPAARRARGPAQMRPWRRGGGGGEKGAAGRRGGQPRGLDTGEEGGSTRTRGCARRALGQQQGDTENWRRSRADLPAGNDALTPPAQPLWPAQPTTWIARQGGDVSYCNAVWLNGIRLFSQLFSIPSFFRSQSPTVDVTHARRHHPATTPPSRPPHHPFPFRPLPGLSG